METNIMETNYVTPTIEVIEIELEGSVLDSSGLEGGSRENAF